MQKKELICVIVVQLILVFVAFHHSFLHPNLYLFDNWYDGLKNYFTWYGYISYNSSDSFFKYNLMNYPYGDFIFFTDNSPIFAVLMRILKSKFVIEKAIAIHNLFFILAIIPSTILLYKILQIIIKNNILRVLASICIPWILPQFFRIDNHFNLSMSVFFFWNLLSLIKSYTHFNKENNISFLWSISLFFSLFISSFFHLYFAVILCMFSIGFYFFVFLLERNRKYLKVASLYISIVLLSVSIVYILLYLIDDYSAMRLKQAQGYDWLSWKLSVESLFMRNEWFLVPFIYNYEKNLGIETYAYLGSFALYGTLFIIVNAILSKKKFKANKLIIILFLAGLLMLIISFGENITIASNDTTFKNFLNPFFYIHFISDSITQFRCLGRFGWYFVIVYNIVILYYVDKIVLEKNKQSIFGFILISLMIIDLFSVVKNRFDISPSVSTFHPSNLDKYAALLSNIETDKYQAILYFPYFNVGAENYDYTIDPDYRACVEAFQISYLLKLPLMNAKLSRTPLQYVKNLLDFSMGNPNKDIISKLNNKNILVFINKEIYKNGYKPTNKNALKMYEKQNLFIEKINKNNIICEDEIYLISLYNINTF